MSWLLKFLPYEKRMMLAIMHDAYSSLDTAEERQELRDLLIKAVADGRVTTIEWTKLGRALGVFKARVN